VLDRQQRRLHDRAHTLGFADLHSHLAARCQQDAGLTQLAGELHTTRDVIRRLIDQAAIHRTPPKDRSARQRRRTTDQHLTERAGQLGFADLGAYLTDRMTQRAWTLIQVAGELGIHEDTVRDRLERHGLGRTGQTVRKPADTRPGR
jgi:AraC-like DNA-binding protein